MLDLANNRSESTDRPNFIFHVWKRTICTIRSLRMPDFYYLAVLLDLISNAWRRLRHVGEHHFRLLSDVSVGSQIEPPKLTSFD